MEPFSEEPRDKLSGELSKEVLEKKSKELLEEFLEINFRFIFRNRIDHGCGTIHRRNFQILKQLLEKLLGEYQGHLTKNCRRRNFFGETSGKINDFAYGRGYGGICRRISVETFVTDLGSTP